VGLEDHGVSGYEAPLFTLRTAENLVGDLVMLIVAIYERVKGASINEDAPQQPRRGA